jgi:hypothetical protein
LWRPEDDDGFIESPVESEDPEETAALSEVFEEEVEGAMEYAVSMWSRWLTTFPTRLETKDTWHTIFRLSNTRVYEDLARAGNRVLAAWVGRGYYHFATHDVTTNRANVVQNINYDN